MKLQAAVLLFAVASVNGFAVTPGVANTNLQKKYTSSSSSSPASVFRNRGGALAQVRSPSSSSLKSVTSSPSSETEVDTGAILKYGSAAVVQISLIASFFYGLDYALAATGNTALPTPLTWILFYAFSIRSRTFNPLNNARPAAAKGDEKRKGFNDRIQPSWTPPGVVFPIMWLLIIAPLRATSSTFIVEAMGGYLSLPLMSLMLHLTIGDIWNTINNTEKRFGTSVVGVSAVWASALHAAYRYYEVDPLAGQLLGATAIWLTIASALIFQTWRLNVDENGEKASLLPTKVVGEESVTKFSWGAK